MRMERRRTSSTTTTNEGHFGHYYSCKVLQGQQPFSLPFSLGSSLALPTLPSKGHDGGAPKKTLWPFQLLAFFRIFFACFRVEIQRKYGGKRGFPGNESTGLQGCAPYEGHKAAERRKLPQPPLESSTSERLLLRRRWQRVESRVLLIVILAIARLHTTLLLLLGLSSMAILEQQT